MSDDFSDEELMAYADGELAPARSEKLAAALPERSDLASRVALFAQTRIVAAESVKAHLDAPVPLKLQASVEEMIRQAAPRPSTATVTALPPRKTASRPAPFGNWAVPIAASFFLAVIAGALGYWLASGGATSSGYYQIAGTADPELAQLLSKLPSGEKSRLAGTGAEVSMIASFYRSDQALCREFAVTHAGYGEHLAVACRGAGTWNIDLALRMSGGGADAYRPASSAETVDAFLEALGVGPAITGQAEVDALGKTR